MSAATDYERLLAGLGTFRWDYLRVLADAAEEAGEPKLAAGWRWLADNRKWPNEMGEVGLAWRCTWRARTDDPPFVLPWGMFQALDGMSTYTHLKSVPEALEHAARAAGKWLARRKRKAK
jgi:hypothetical protein